MKIPFWFYKLQYSQRGKNYKMFFMKLREDNIRHGVDFLLKIKILEIYGVFTQYCMKVYKKTY